jgi:hypothetical protein
MMLELRDELISGFLDVVAAPAVLQGKTDSELVLNKSYSTRWDLEESMVWGQVCLGIANNGRFC